MRRQLATITLFAGGALAFYGTRDPLGAVELVDAVLSSIRAIVGV